ncbi:MAG TPA: AfsR/SARP family transcriptional regulator [Actinocrinis sp.]|jgi:DNA-binding SARP family transcriptional activator
MRYEILGSLKVCTGPAARTIGAHKIETLLGTLLVRADQLVLSDQLIAEVWGDRPPSRALAGIHVYVSQLRKFLAADDPAHRPIATGPSGYRLRLGRDELDARVFLDRVADGRAFAKEGLHAEAENSLSTALALWRGPLLGETCHGPILGGFSTWLGETHAECMELLVEAQMQQGRHREAVGRLYSLIAEHPLREVFHRQLMLALYRCGRQADALKAYQNVRSTLIGELGIEPSRELKEMHQAILASDPRLDLKLAAAAG